MLAEKRRDWLSPIIQSSHPPTIPRPAPPHRLDLFIFKHTPTIHRTPFLLILTASRQRNAPKQATSRAVSAGDTYSYPCCTRPATYTSWRCMSKPSHVFCSHQDTANTKLVLLQVPTTDTPSSRTFLCSHVLGNKRARERAREREEKKKRRARKREKSETEHNTYRRAWEESMGGERGRREER